MLSNEDQAQRSRLFHRITIGTMALATGALVTLMLVQPAHAARALMAVAAVNALGLALVLVNRRGHTRAASIALVAGLITLVTVMSFTGGGIRSPGVTMFFVFVLMAGLLLGQRAGTIAATICAVIGLVLAVFGVAGVLPPPAVEYSPFAIWLLNCLYMGVVLILLRLATDAMTSALGRAESEIAVRRRTEVERLRVVEDLGERVKELRLLHAAARVLQGSPPLDRSVLEQIVRMMPDAWRHPPMCEARIVYGDLEVSTSGWRESRWHLSAPFSTSDGRGVVEVVYIADVPHGGDGPFLVEERTLLESVADMLATYLEHDIAKRRRAQLETQLRQSQQMEALGTLAGGIAHDFNNLLAAIGANADLALTEPSASPPVKEHLVELHRAHGRAADLVKRILLFSRRQDADRKPIEIAPVVNEAIQLLRASLPAMIDIRVTAGPELPAVLADASQMHQVVMNLGTNAAHAMAERGGVLQIELDSVTIGRTLATPAAGLQPGRYVHMAVRDTGTGMTPEVRSRVFEPFFTTKGTAGTGLGLSVVHGIVADHGGAITVDSESGKGSTFHVYLPSAGVEAVQPSAAAEIVQGQGEHIMYVDDEEALVLVMTRVLRRLGYRCTGFSEADEALEAFRAHPHDFSAVVTDMAMPKMSGAMLAEKLRAIRPDVPVAIVSGYESTEPGAAGAGILRIGKPVAMDKLSHALRQLTER